MSDPRIRTGADPYSPSRSVEGRTVSVELLAGLCDPAETTFHRALGRLSKRPGDAAATIAFLKSFLSALATESRLTDRTRADRLTAVLRRVEPGPEVLAELAAAARAHPAGIRMAVAQTLPPAQRVLLAPINDVTTTFVGAGDHRESTSPPLSPASQGEAAVSSDRSRIRNADAPSADVASSDGTIGMVAILSRPDLQEANKRLLHEKGFAAVPWNSVARLKDELSTNFDVCACVIDGSILSELDGENQRELFRFLGEYSSFLWIRIHDSGLSLTFPEIRDLIKQARCARGTVPHISLQADSQLRPNELSDFRRSAESLQASSGTSFVPSELDASQVRVLVAAVREFWNAHELGTDVQISLLETRFIAGGRSGAVLVRIRVNGGGQPLIAKVGPSKWIIAESRRLRTFVEHWDRAVHPETFLHGTCGVILFPLVSNDEDRDSPADTMEERLAALWNDQVMGSSDGTAPQEWAERLRGRRQAMIRGVRMLSVTLANLNRQRPPTSASLDQFPPYGNPLVQPLDRLQTQGVEWRFSRDVQTARARAQTRLERMPVHAVVHGDIHLRNVLLRGDRDATLIDFASCGPGHPGVDLARLDVVLFTDGMRQLVTEARCIEFQHALSIDRASAASLHAAFPDLLACHVNIVCAEGAVLARDAALTVLQQFDGDDDDYLAAKYLVASQALLVLGRSTGMARAIVEALTPALLAWTEDGAGRAERSSVDH